MFMGPARLGTKNDCAGEDQRQFTRLSVLGRGIGQVRSLPTQDKKTEQRQICNHTPTRNLLLAT
jgi:hypothetical protein